MDDTEGSIRIAGIALIILFILPLEIHFFREYREGMSKLGRCTKSVKGTIVSVSKSKRTVDPVSHEDAKDNEYDYHAIIQYTVNGETYTTNMTYLSIVFTGRHEKVYYNPKDPQDCFAGFGLRFIPYMSFLAMLMFAVFAVVLVIAVIL